MQPTHKLSPLAVRKRQHDFLSVAEQLDTGDVIYIALYSAWMLIIHALRQSPAWLWPLVLSALAAALMGLIPPARTLLVLLALPVVTLSAALR